jgi:hypothetical protein
MGVTHDRESPGIAARSTVAIRSCTASGHKHYRSDLHANIDLICTSLSLYAIEKGR